MLDYKYLRDMACLRVNKGGKIRNSVITFQATLAGVMNCVRFGRMGTRGKIQLSLPSFAADCSASAIRRLGRQQVTTCLRTKMIIKVFWFCKIVLFLKKVADQYLRLVKDGLEQTSIARI